MENDKCYCSNQIQNNYYKELNHPIQSNSQTTNYIITVMLIRITNTGPKTKATCIDDNYDAITKSSINH